MVLFLVIGFYFKQSYKLKEREYPVLNVSEVYLHNNSKDCWVIYKKKVYNLTNVILDNDTDITRYCGRDITHLLNNITTNNIYFQYFEVIFEDRVIGVIK